MARARSIGNVYAELSVRDKMTVGVSKARKNLNAFGKDMVRIGSVAGGALAAGIGAAVVAMKSAIDAGGQLSDMMAQTGAGGEGLFVMQRAFENAGIAGEKVPGVINKMQKALAGLSDTGQAINTRVWGDLGMQASELRSMDPGMAFRSIAEAIAKIPDPAKRAAVAMEIFGKSGGELLVVMNDGKAFQNAADQVGGLGATLAENADRLDRVSDAFGLLSTKAQQVGAEMAVALLPQLESFVAQLESADLSAIGQAMGIMATEAGYMAEALAETVQMIPGMQRLADMIISPNLSESDKAKARAMADQWAANDPKAYRPGAAEVDPFALPAGAEEARKAEWRMSAPGPSSTDQKIIDEIRRTNAILGEAQTSGGLTW